MPPGDRRPRLPALLALLAPLACQGGGATPAGSRGDGAPSEAAAASGSATPDGGPEVMEARPDRSAPLWLMPTPRARPRLDRRPGTIPMNKDGGPPDGGASPQGLAPPGGAPLLAAPVAAGPAMPAPLLGFDGIGQGFPMPGGGTYAVTSAPPDPVGAAGPNHYLAAVNTDLAVFRRDGSVVMGPVALNTLWSGFTGANDLCETTNQGDPIVLYDSLADRWFVSQLAFDLSGSNPAPPFYQCVAVSATGDPTGSWNRYAFGPFTSGGKAALNDYPKFGLWPDAYYASYNMFDLSTNPESYLGVKVCALERTAMIAGTTARQVCQDLAPRSNGGLAYSLLPAHLDGRRPPPEGSPGLYASWDFSKGTLRVWTFAVTWGATPTAAVSSQALAIPALTMACPSISGCDCVAQPGTATLLDSLCDRLMFRLAYRNFGGHESLVAAHIVAQGANANPTGVQWYELRNAPGQTLAAAPVIYQSGTTPLDSTFRWLPSAAMDQMGNLAVGYSSSSSSDYPGLRYSGRLWSDPADTLAQGETVLFTGSGSQTTYLSSTTCGGCNAPPCTCPLDRWGDYSAMVIDPVDDCTFWYVNEYLPSSGGMNWRTRIGAFAFPACPPRYAVAGPDGAVEVEVPLTLTVKAEDALGTAFADYGGSAVLSSSDPQAVLPAGPVAFSGGVATATVTFKTAGTQTVTAMDSLYPAVAGTYAATVSGAAAAPASPAPASSSGCGCGGGAPGEASLLVLAVALTARRRPRRRGGRPAAPPPPR